MTSSSSTASSLSELIASMEQATLAAKQLSRDPTRIHEAQACLSRAQAQLSAVQSLSSSSDDPMQLEDSPVTENSVQMVDRVEEKMRSCFIRCKRRKRRLSPEAISGAEDEAISGAGERKEVFDPYATRFRSLELVHQFHL